MDDILKVQGVDSPKRDNDKVLKVGYLLFLEEQINGLGLGIVVLGLHPKRIA